MGIEYQIGSIFAQALARYGLGIAIASAFAFVVIGVGAFFLVTRIRIMQASAMSDDAERARESIAREKERDKLIAELSISRQQHEMFLTNHLEHDRQEREALGAILKETSVKDAQIVESLRQIARDVEEHRAEESDRAGKVLGKLEDLRVGQARLEGGK